MAIMIEEGYRDKISVQDCLDMHKRGYFAIFDNHGGVCCFFLEELW